jgi:hypothetical protein
MANSIAGRPLNPRRAIENGTFAELRAQLLTEYRTRGASLDQ